MESELKFCRQCGKERSDGEDACAGCGWSFVEKVTSTVKPLTSSALRMMAQQPRRIKVGTKYEALQVLLNIVVFLSAVVTVFAVGCLAVSKTSMTMALPAIGWSATVGLGFLIVVAIRQFVQVFIDIEFGVRTLVAHAERQGEGS